VRGSGLKPFLLENAGRVKAHAVAMAEEVDRPVQYLASSFRKEDAARKIPNLNGHEWLARKLVSLAIRFTKLDNVFAWIDDLPQAQRLANRFSELNWPRILNRYASRVVPQLGDVLCGCQYYWVAAQAEYSTDVMFKTAAGLRELYPRLLSHSTLCFGATEVMNFLGRKLNGHFQGEVVSDLSSLVCPRVGGSRIKHRVKQNWLKMYDKAGLVLRVETVINNPEEFRVRKQVLRDGKQRAEWVPLRKGVAYLFRYREISLQANARYLDAPAAVDDPTPGKQALQRLTTVKKDAAGRSCPGSMRRRNTTPHCSRASWPASTACTASPTGTSAPN
jgi:hypothetical protein